MASTHLLKDVPALDQERSAVSLPILNVGSRSELPGLDLSEHPGTTDNSTGDDAAAHRASARSSGTAEEQAVALPIVAAPLNTHAVQQEAYRRQVQRDIKKLLHANKTYVQHTKGPTVIKRGTLEKLAQPKLSGAHPDVAIGIPDPVDFARWKTEQLAIKRMTAEREQREVQQAKQAAQAQLQQYRRQQDQEARALAQGAATAAEEEHKYAKTLSKFLNHKGAQELQEFKRRQEDARQRAATVHTQRTARGLGFEA